MSMRDIHIPMSSIVDGLVNVYIKSYLTRVKSRWATRG